MHEEEYINSLIEKHLAGTITPAEQKELDEWYAKLHTPPEQHGGKDANLRERIYAAIEKRIQPTPVKLVRHIWWRVAAAIVPAAILTTILYNQHTRKQSKDTLLDLYTHEGGLSKITLTDSTVVWLNANSHLRYPQTITGNRTVYLEGEAWFDVHQDPAHPFVIESKGYRTRVLGTTFSIRSYTAPNTYKVTVSSGKVAVYTATDSSHAVLLTANQEVRFDGDAGTKEVRTVAAKSAMAWKEGALSFERDQLSEVATALQNRYGAKFIFEKDALRSIKISGQFDRTQSLEDIMKILSKVYNLHFKRGEGKKISIS
jgi:transmembrane sensor